MSERTTPITPEEPDIPAEAPTGPDDPSPETPDVPLGVPAGLDPEDAPLPGQGRYAELTSTSNTTDFQARRLDVRYRPADGGGPRHVHTLNGTAVAVGRTLIALLENGQRDDGTIALPEVLRPWGAPELLRVGDPG